MRISTSGTGSRARSTRRTSPSRIAERWPIRLQRRKLVRKLVEKPKHRHTHRSLRGEELAIDDASTAQRCNLADEPGRNLPGSIPRKGLHPVETVRQRAILLEQDGDHSIVRTVRTHLLDRDIDLFVLVPARSVAEQDDLEQ